LSLMPIGISDNRAQAQSETVHAIRQRYRGRRIVFSLGRMTYYKGFDVLIDAAQALPDDCVVLIGGDGDLLDHYRATVRERGLSGKVHLLGQVLDHELVSHFEACDVFCLPSTARAEAYGVAILEAMVTAKPIVATDITGSGVPWVNVDGVTGLNVPVRQPQLLANALIRLLGDAELRARLGAAARERYLQHFSAEVMTRRTIELYEGLPRGRTS
jgi:glycosyltransferase involved in cell wall biosynthesis